MQKHWFTLAICLCLVAPLVGCSGSIPQDGFAFFEQEYFASSVEEQKSILEEYGLASHPENADHILHVDKLAFGGISPLSVSIGFRTSTVPALFYRAEFTLDEGATLEAPGKTYEQLTEAATKRYGKPFGKYVDGADMYTVWNFYDVSLALNFHSNDSTALSPGVSFTLHPLPASRYKSFDAFPPFPRSAK